MGKGWGQGIEANISNNLHIAEKVCPPSTAVEGLIIIGKQTTVKLLWHMKRLVHKNYVHVPQWNK